MNEPELNQRALGLTRGLLNEVKEGVLCMLVKFFARKAAWLKTSRAKHPGYPTPKTAKQ